VACGLLVAGCTGRTPVQPSPTLSLKTVYIGAPTPTGIPASPTPTTIASPSPTTTPTPTQSLYDQAVAVYQVFYDEQARILAAGGAETLPPEMAAVLSDTAVGLMTGAFSGMRQHGIHYVGTPQFSLLSVRPYAADMPDGTVVAVETCEEIAGASLYDKDGVRLEDSNDNLYSYRAFLKYNEKHRLVIFTIEGGYVAVCPS